MFLAFSQFTYNNIFDFVHIVKKIVKFRSFYKVWKTSIIEFKVITSAH